MMHKNKGNALLVIILIMSFTVLLLTHYWLCYTMLYQAVTSQTKLDKKRTFLKVAGLKSIVRIIDLLDFENNQDMVDRHLEFDTDFFKPKSMITVHITSAQSNNVYLCTVSLLENNETLTNKYLLRSIDGAIEVEPVCMG